MRCLLTAVLALPLFATSAAALEACKATPEIKAKTTLEEMSNIYFGDTSYEYAIMLATNARAFTKDFKFISDENNLPKTEPGKPVRLCIPQSAEATTLKNRFELYLDAVSDMALAEPGEVVSTLNPVPKSGPVKVVSWIRKDQASNLAKSVQLGADYTPTSDMWVTLDPHLKEFCQDYAKTHSDELNAVTLRVEQRLGLPPNASKTDFAIFEIANPQDRANLFRPCGDSEVTDTSCELGPPSCKAEANSITTAQNNLDKGTTSEKPDLKAKLAAAQAELITCEAGLDKEKDFFFKQYYNSYGQAHPVEYPWTSLGYTFDWAPGPSKVNSIEGFVVVGESEYVVPAGTKIIYQGQMSTAAYCKPKQ